MTSRSTPKEASHMYVMCIRLYKLNSTPVLNRARQSVSPCIWWRNTQWWIPPISRTSCWRTGPSSPAPWSWARSSWSGSMTLVSGTRYVGAAIQNNGLRQMCWLLHLPYSKKVLVSIQPLGLWACVFSPYLHGFCTGTSFSSCSQNSSRASWLETLNCPLIWAGESQSTPSLAAVFSCLVLSDQWDRLWLEIGCCSQKINDGCDNNYKNHPHPYFWFYKPVICFYQECDLLKHQPLYSCCPLILAGYTGSLAVGKQSLQWLWRWPCNDSFSGRVWKQSGERSE